MVRTISQRVSWRRNLPITKHNGLNIFINAPINTLKDIKVLAICESMTEKRYRDGIKYSIEYTPSSKKFKCSCPDYIYRREKLNEDCKHINSLKRLIKSS